MKTLWLDWTIDHKGELFTITWKIRQRQWEILSSKRFVTPFIIKDEPANVSEDRAKELILKAL